ncbi:hypothetical protein B1H42_23190 [Enterobacter cloacae subsp. cloacae]|nr:MULTISPECIES: S-type pyocin domain-containing protein [Enterobacter cloacae complex]MCR6728705.1 S-type pyocin domain-containing protein [Enterobacter cloacae]ORC16173.1 hypothetical protein B1H42_23190 [Enterobacter cloacae subsp. cloacae]ORC25020.1 hypothetical protein B2M05_24755 [Enterobacter cloacae subsp. cloacae]UUR75503.1 S-type pyocin domain-containing protein [Enterobacter cloacae complex sp. R_G8]
MKYRQPGAPVLPNPVIVNPLPDDTAITATTSPAPEEKSFADYILILPFPDLPPIYIYLRHNFGQVTGKGKKVSGIWLFGANVGNGSPVPSQIADRLRGRTFANCDQFRKAFWLEVSKDPELSKQFRGSNQVRYAKETLLSLEMRSVLVEGSALKSITLIL